VVHLQATVDRFIYKSRKSMNKIVTEATSSNSVFAVRSLKCFGASQIRKIFIGDWFNQNL